MGVYGQWEQFYLIAPILYKAVKNKSVITLVVSIVISWLIRLMFYRYFSIKSYDSAYYFVYGRQIITAIESFAIGMFISKNDKVFEKKYINGFITCLIAVLFTILLAQLSIKYSNPNYLLFYSLYYTLLSISIGLFVIAFCSGKLTNINLFRKYSGLAKFEYNIYLWHFLIIANLLNTEFIRNLRIYSSSICALILLLIAILYGIFINIYTCGVKKNG